MVENPEQHLRRAAKGTWQHDPFQLSAQRRTSKLYRTSLQTYDGDFEGGLLPDDYSPTTECDPGHRSYLHMNTEPPVTPLS
jgi:hypothetical protein